MFISSKNKSVVGLDIEAGSIAATEVRVNGSVEITGTGVTPLAAGPDGAPEPTIYRLAVDEIRLVKVKKPQGVGE